jgi:glycosyltransferase involved in cell wall biosynthesis
VFGTFRTDLHPRVDVLVEGLRDNGLRVDVVNEPLPLDTAHRVAMLRHPWRLAELLLALARCWARLWVRGRRAARDRPTAVLVGYLGHFDVHLARWVFGRRPTLVLDHLVFAEDTARDRHVTAAGRLALLRRLDHWALHRADVVVCDTEEHATRARAAGASRVVTVPVGAAEAWWRTPPRDSGEPGDPVRVIFFGLFTPLHGTATIAEAVRGLPGELPFELTLVGRGQDHADTARALSGDRRVRFVDWLSEPELRAEVAAHDVVLGVFGTGDKARRVVPTKAYQGLAAGRAVVTSDTPPQRRVLGDAAVLVPPGDAPALAEALAGLCRDRDLVRELGRRGRERAADRFRPTPATADLADLLAGVTRVPGRRRVQPPPLTLADALRWAVVEPRLARLRPRRVLEIGCGTGALGARIAAMPGVSYTGIEADAPSCRAAVVALGSSGAVLHGSDEVAAGLPGPWDVLCAFDVLGHDDAVLRRWWSRTVPGGHLVLSVPAGRGEPAWYDRDRLRRVLADAGWDDVAVARYGQVAGPFLAALAARDGAPLSARGALPALAARAVVVALAAARPFLPGPATGLVAVARRPATRPGARRAPAARSSQAAAGGGPAAGGAPPSAAA